MMIRLALAQTHGRDGGGDGKVDVERHERDAGRGSPGGHDGAQGGGYVLGIDADLQLLDVDGEGVGEVEVAALRCARGRMVGRGGMGSG